MQKELDRIDRKIVSWMKKWNFDILRYSLAVIFIWLGVLKPLGLSPAAELVANTVFWFDASWFVPFLGWWEVAIGVCLLIKPLIRIGLGLMALQMYVWGQSTYRRTAQAMGLRAGRIYCWVSAFGKSLLPVAALLVKFFAGNVWDINFDITVSFA